MYPSRTPKCPKVKSMKGGSGGYVLSAIKQTNTLGVLTLWGVSPQEL